MEINQNKNQKNNSVNSDFSLDLQNPKSFHGITDIRHYVGRTCRSESEAFKDSYYACAIEKHSSDIRHAIRWFSELFAFFFWAGCALAAPALLVIWITR